MRGKNEWQFCEKVYSQKCLPKRIKEMKNVLIDRNLNAGLALSGDTHLSSERLDFFYYGCLFYNQMCNQNSIILNFL